MLIIRLKAKPSLIHTFWIIKQAPSLLGTSEINTLCTFILPTRYPYTTARFLTTPNATTDVTDNLVITLL